MSCERFGPLLSGYVDGELAAEERRRLEEHLKTCEACRGDLEGLKTLKDDLALLKFREPSDAELERYWAGVYNRLERGMGWILISLGAILLLSYGAFQFVESFLLDSPVSWVVKVGAAVLVSGLVVLLVSLVRERLVVRKTDRYSKEVDR